MNQLILGPGMFRLVLALLVLLSHISRFQSGRIAVILFFLLSGYWVSSLWLRKDREAHVLYFYTNRFLRIWPLYFVVALATAVGFGWHPSLTTFTLLGIATASPSGKIGVEWSLDIELQFYLLLPLIHVLLSRLPPLATLLLALLGSLVGWGLSAWLEVETVFKYLPAFLTGVVIYRQGIHAGPRTATLSLIAFMAMTVLLFLLPATKSGIIKTGVDSINEDLVAMIWAVPLLPYVVASIRKKSDQFDRMVGDFSYPLYLAHWPVISFCLQNGTGKPLAAALGISISLLLFFLIDRPFERIRRRALS